MDRYILYGYVILMYLCYVYKKIAIGHGTSIYNITPFTLKLWTLANIMVDSIFRHSLTQFTSLFIKFQLFF